MTAPVAASESIRFDFIVNGVGDPSGCAIDDRPCERISG
jgi:hypothetical protein